MTDPQPEILADLGDGLRLRRSTAADAEALAAFNARIHAEGEPDAGFGVAVADWTRDLLTSPPPGFAPDDFTVVEHQPTGQIISCLNLINQEWSYGGVPFGVGRVELVGTLPEYRARGLVRRQFEVIHAWSKQRGHLVQGITGIPYYYRQFGYEMTLTLGGGRSGFTGFVPTLEAGESEPYLIRPATVADAPFLAETYAATVGKRDLVASLRPEAMWRYDLAGRRDRSLLRELICVITTPAGAPVGYLVHLTVASQGGPGNGLALTGYELAPGMGLLTVTPSVIRYLWSKGGEMAAAEGKTVERFTFALGGEHPAYAAYQDVLPWVRPPYAWYIRVADLPGFVQHVRPALEAHLAHSAAQGVTAELKLSFYRGGLRLVIEQGRLTTVEPWQPPVNERGDAGFPNLTFLQLLFGYRTLEELQYAYADCYCNGNRARALLTALFPKRASNVWGIA